MKLNKWFILIMLWGMVNSCKEQSVALDFDPISFSLIDEHVLAKSTTEFNVVFFISGKSCFICSDHIIAFVNDFVQGKYAVTAIGNDPQVGQAINPGIAYVELEQLELERYGFKMSDSEIYIFIGDDLIYKNTVSESEFVVINSKMQELND